MNPFESIKNEYLDKFRLFREVTLFEPNYKNLKIGKCPLCGNLLKEMRNGNKYCKGSKHKKSPFFMRKK